MRMKPHQIDTTGAAAGNALVYDPATDTWGPGSAAGGSSLTVQDENGTVASGVTQIDFQGAGVTAASGTGEVIVTIPGASGGSLTVQDENGNVATGVTQLDFQGAGVTATAGTGEVVVTIPGSSGGGGGGVLLLEAGQGAADVPSGTATGTIIFRKARTRRNAIIADAPAAFLTLDETTGNWLDLSGSSRNFTPGTGVVRGKASLVSDDTGYAASGSGTANIGVYSGTHGITATNWSMEFVLKLPSGSGTTYKGGIMKMGTNGNGASIGVGASTDTALGRNFVYGRNGINYYVPGVTLPTDGAAHHFAIVCDSASTWRTYQDGALVATSGSSTTITTPANELRCGDAETNYIPSDFTLDNVAWFPSALSSTQVAGHAGLNLAGAIGWWDGSAIRPLG